MVTSDLFRSKVEKPKKGKGSYQRKARNQKGHQHKGDAPFDLSRHKQKTGTRPVF
nr:alternative ribosome rescue factor ArfA [Shewanella litorisediminis]